MTHLESSTNNSENKRLETKAPYIPPNIIYEGKIGIRAGSPEAVIPGVLPETESMPFTDTQN